MSDTYFYIDRPTISSGFRKTYHKKLEVLEIEEVKHSGTIANLTRHFKVIAVHKYSARAKDWVKKETKANKKVTVYERNIASDVESLTSAADKCVFKDLNTAIAMKLFLIQTLKKTYDYKIKQLQELAERNIPDVTALVQEMKDTYPEIYI